MADRPPSERWSGELEVLEIRVTVLADDRKHPFRELIDALHSRSATRVIVTVAAVLAAAAAILAAALIAAEQHVQTPRRASAGSAGALGVAAAYGYPRRCLSITIFPEYPDYARADFDHGQPCGRYSGYSTAIFLRVDHVWRVVLDASAYPCPVRMVPVRVQAELGICATPPP